MATSITTSGEVLREKNPRPVPATNWSVRSWADSINLQWTGLQERMVAVEGIRDRQSHHSGHDGKGFIIPSFSHRLPNPKRKGMRLDSSERAHLSIVGNRYGVDPGHRRETGSELERPSKQTEEEKKTRQASKARQIRGDNNPTSRLFVGLIFHASAPFFLGRRWTAGIG